MNVYRSQSKPTYNSTSTEQKEMRLKWICTLLA